MELNVLLPDRVLRGHRPVETRVSVPSFKVSRPSLGPQPVSWVDTATVSTRACPLEKQDTDDSNQKVPESLTLSRKLPGEY